MKTLSFLRTHKITQELVNEYHKLKNTDTDVIILFDNKFHTYKKPERSLITTIELFGEKLPVLLMDFESCEKLRLPGYYDEKNNTNFNGFLWYNGDYPIYVVSRFLPDYDYYWQIEYDVYCNGESYQEFFDIYKDRKIDLLASGFGIAQNDWWCREKTEWIYNRDTIIGSCLFPIVRVSKDATDYLYQRRLEHGKLYKKLKHNENVRWVFCEAFVATEIGNHETLYAETITGQNIAFAPNIDIKTDSRFIKQDNKIYHPVKIEGINNIKRYKSISDTIIM